VQATAEAEHCRSVYEGAAAKAAAAAKSASDLFAQVVKLTSELASKREAHEAAAASAQAYEARACAGEERVVALESELAVCKERNAHLAALIDRQEAELAALHNELVHLREEHTALQAQQARLEVEAARHVRETREALATVPEDTHVPKASVCRSFESHSVLPGWLRTPDCVCHTTQVNNRQNRVGFRMTCCLCLQDAPLAALAGHTRQALAALCSALEECTADNVQLRSDLGVERESTAALQQQCTAMQVAFDEVRAVSRALRSVAQQCMHAQDAQECMSDNCPARPNWMVQAGPSMPCSPPARSLFKVCRPAGFKRSAVLRLSRPVISSARLRLPPRSSRPPSTQQLPRARVWRWWRWWPQAWRAKAGWRRRAGPRQRACCSRRSRRCALVCVLQGARAVAAQLARARPASVGLSIMCYAK
jgi:hypothetical protein